MRRTASRTRRASASAEYGASLFPSVPPSCFASDASVLLITTGAIRGAASAGASKSFSRSAQCACKAAIAAALTGTVRCLRRLPTMVKAQTVTLVGAGAASLGAALVDDLVDPLAKVLARPPDVTTATLR